MKRYALHGGRFSGKSTLAKSLVERGFVLVNYTDYLKKLYVRSLQAVGIDITLADVVDHKEEERPHIISLGKRIGFDRGEYVEQCLYEEAGSISHPGGLLDKNGTIMDGLYPDIVFDNVRFLPQYQVLSEYEFVLVRLITPFSERLRRALGAGYSPEEFEESSKLPSETPLPPVPGEIRLSVVGDMERVINHLSAQLVARETSRRLPNPPVLHAPGAERVPLPRADRLFESEELEQMVQHIIPPNDS